MMSIALVFTLLMFQSGAGVNPAFFTEVHKAAKAVETGAGADTTLARFSELTQSLVRALAVSKEKLLSESDTDLYSDYSDLRDVYVSSIDVWTVASRKGKRPEFRNQIPYRVNGVYDETLKPIVERYKIPISSVVQTGGVEDLTIPEDSVQFLWKLAASRAPAVHEKYLEATR